MKLYDLRAAVKGIVKGTPFFPLFKKIYNKIKLYSDKRQFRLSYPQALYVEYSLSNIKDQHNKGFHSQYGQDFFLWENFLKKSDNKFFIDIGANDPVVNSNSHFLEKAGWSGVAIDPIPRFEKEWKSHRKCTFYCGAVSEEKVEMDYIEILSNQGWEHALSGFKSCVRQEDMDMYEYIEYQVAAKPLAEYVNKEQDIEVLMIDVEGAEMLVLKGIDFKQIKPNYIMIENIGQLGGCNKIRSYIQEQGYSCVARIAATDDVFERKTPAK